MDRVYKFGGVFVILIILLSESRQNQEDDNLDKKISEIFGTPPLDGETTNRYPNLNPNPNPNPNPDPNLNSNPNPNPNLNPNPNPNPYPPLTQSTPTVPYVITIQQTEALPISSSSSPPSENNPCLQGECVPYYQCQNGSIITSGEGILDIRLGEEDNPDPNLHPCKGLFLTCCVLKYEDGEEKKPKIEVKKECGHRNIEGVGFRIIGDNDNEAQYGEFPWMVAIIKEESSLQDILNVYQCGGSLIHPSVVLTAAHCVHGKRNSTLKIRAGEWDTQTQDELFPHQDRYVREIVIHENYYRGGLFNNIALLILQEPVTINEVVNTICLPQQDYNFDGTQNRCFASGWGKDLWGKDGKYQVFLKKIDLPIIPRELCQERLRRTRLGIHFNLHRSFLCAGGERGKDTCKGDGGSPLACPIPGKYERYFQSGIVSWGIGCADVNPGVYANVALFRNWIDQQFAYKNLETNYYSV